LPQQSRDEKTMSRFDRQYLKEPWRRYTGGLSRLEGIPDRDIVVCTACAILSNYREMGVLLESWREKAEHASCFFNLPIGFFKSVE